MLHGCTQDPKDFAAGTCMNALADRHDFVVVYPAQSRAHNAMGCWNWFNPPDQRRDRGEPSLIVGIALQVAAQHAIDLRRIFVAGLSAGGAMAVILGETYPEVFAGLGVHSGLPFGVAHSAAGALAAMQGEGLAEKREPPAAAPTARPVPRIVFHGDADATVDISNGAEVVRRAVVREAAAGGPLHEVIENRTAAGGRTYTTTRYRRGAELPVVEFWVVHGAGHAWSGGSPAGSFTDAEGPDASAEMVRFFLEDERAVR